MAPTSLHIIFAGLILILSLFQYESPRFLVKRGKLDQALETMSKLRHLPKEDPYVVNEVSAICRAHEEEMEATKGAGWFGVLKEMFLVPSNLYRIYLSSMVQFLSQWSGAGSITLYAPDLFKLLGITGQNESLLVTAVFGIVKLTAAIICALFLVDVIGRKRALLIGITFQAISMLYIAGFLTAVPELGVVDDYVLPTAEAGASRGAVAMIYISGMGWALGWNSVSCADLLHTFSLIDSELTFLAPHQMQYLLTAELFPLRIRAVATSFSMMLHFVNQYGNSRAVSSNCPLP